MIKKINYIKMYKGYDLELLEFIWKLEDRIKLQDKIINEFLGDKNE